MAGITRKVPGLSRAKIESEATGFVYDNFREFHNEPGQLPLAHFFNSGRMAKVIGFEEEFMDLHPKIAGYADFTTKQVVLSTNSHDSLENGEAHARFTISHEIGHVVLHAPYFEGIHYETFVKPKTLKRGDIPAYQDAEWQANNFAAALLMPGHHVKRLLRDGHSVEEIADIFGTSYTSALYRCKTVINKL